MPHQTGEDSLPDEDILYLPDRETALRTPAMYCLTNSIYRIMLGHCAGIQAVTTIAMRSACDNAEKSLEELPSVPTSIVQQAPCEAFPPECKVSSYSRK